MTITDLPALNAALNSLATVFIVSGLIAIKTGRKRAHGGLMTGALICSAAFLTSYLIYHYQVQHTSSGHMPEKVRPFYLGLLATHILAAIVNLPMVLGTVLAAARGKFERHKKWARLTYPVWLYVSITGVLVYFILYQWYPAP